MGLDVAAGADREEAGNSMMVREEVLQLAVESVQDGREAAEVVAIDIGGTLTKIVFRDTKLDTASKRPLPSETVYLRCQIWPTKHIDHCFAHLRSYLHQLTTSAPTSSVKISATGGGAVKYAPELASLIQSSTQISTSKEPDRRANLETQDEMACLASGLSALIQPTSGPDASEINTFDSTSMYPTQDTMDLPTDPAPLCRPTSISSDSRPGCPILLANIGTGASFVLCPSQVGHENTAASEVEPARRIGGTPLTGATLMGILRLITGKTDYSEMLALAATGDSRKVDLTVADVYGADYAIAGLSGHRAAGFLGRIATESADATGEDGKGSYSRADVARSLVFAIAYNVGQQAVLQAKANGAAREICFTGSFGGGGHPLIMGALDFAVRMNGGGEFRAVFLRREGLLGAIGAWTLGRAGNQ